MQSPQISLPKSQTDGGGIPPVHDDHTFLDGTLRISRAGTICIDLVDMYFVMPPDFSLQVVDKERHVAACD